MKVLLIDDHPVINVANAQVLKIIAPRAEFIAGVSFLEAELQRFNDFDLIVADLSVIGATPEGVLATLEGWFPEVKKVYLSPFGLRKGIKDAVCGAGHLFLEKSVSYEKISDVLIPS